jgi:hypothetical protein
VTAPIVWEQGEPGAVIRVQNDAIELRCERAKAPGSRPLGKLANGMEVRVKVHRCKREDKGDGLVFTLEGRLIDATRALLAELDRLLAAPAAD